ncbi:hypothetical protein DBR43_18305 [Pedobacter sp. KBW06]|nr:hypothetical protein DBR43_18305 [Pedobacter sp. KBW06]
MKRIGALSFAAFYLMLTTGLFVCMLHCSGQSLFVQKKTAHAMSENTAGHHAKSGAHGKSCAQDKDCKCCDEHGEYVIKENIKRTASVELTAPSILLSPIQDSFPGLILSEKLINAKKWQLDTGPPLYVKTPLYISNRVLLI